MQSESEWDEITEEANYGREQVEFQTQMRVGQRQARVTEREKEKVNWGQKKNKGERRESLGRQIWGRRRGRLVSIGFEMPWCRCTPAPGFDKSEIEKGGIQGKDKERNRERGIGSNRGEESQQINQQNPPGLSPTHPRVAVPAGPKGRKDLHKEKQNKIHLA